GDYGRRQGDNLEEQPQVVHDHHAAESARVVDNGVGVVELPYAHGNRGQVADDAGDRQDGGFALSPHKEVNEDHRDGEDSHDDFRQYDPQVGVQAVVQVGHNCSSGLFDCYLLKCIEPRL